VCNTRTRAHAAGGCMFKVLGWGLLILALIGLLVVFGVIDLVF
jgi:hypothetical protein